jgi:hypothetical protein
MVYYQRTVPPVQQMIPFHLRQFNGGLNNRSNIHALNEASYCMNVSFYDDLIVEKRPGSKVYTNSDNVLMSDATMKTMVHFDMYRPYTGSDVFVRADSDGIIIDNRDLTTANVFPLSGNSCDGENFLGKYFYVDGAYLRVYGTFPTSNSTYVRIVGSPLLGATVLTVGSTPSSYTPLDASYNKGVTVYDFTQMKVWYEPCLNEKNDPYKGVSVLPSKPRYITSHKGRLFLSGSQSDDDNVFICDVGNPYYFPPALPIQLPPNSDKVVGLATYDDCVVVGRKRDIHVISGTTNNPDLGLPLFELRKLNTHTGFVSNKAISIAHNYLFFVGFDRNCYALSTLKTDTKTLATSLLTKKLDLAGAPFYLSKSDVATAVTAFCDDAWYVSIKGYVFVYYYKIQAWTVWKGLNIRSFFVKDYDLLWSDDDLDICCFSTGYKDKGIPYMAVWETGNIDFGDPSVYKHFRDVFIQAYTFKGYDSDIRMSFELDYSDINGHVIIPSAVARWGVAKYGDKYNIRDVNPSLPFTVGRRARSIKIRFANGFDMKGVVATVSDLNKIVAPSDEDMYHVTSDNGYYAFDRSTVTWVKYSDAQMNQPMRVYQINGEYELRGRR